MTDIDRIIEAINNVIEALAILGKYLSPDEDEGLQAWEEIRVLKSGAKNTTNYIKDSFWYPEEPDAKMDGEKVGTATVKMDAQDARLGNELCTLLMEVAGDSGKSEGAVDVLRRLIDEHKTRISKQVPEKYVDLTGGTAEAPEQTTTTTAEPEHHTWEWWKEVVKNRKKWGALPYTDIANMLADWKADKETLQQTITGERAQSIYAEKSLEKAETEIARVRKIAHELVNRLYCCGGCTYTESAAMDAEIDGKERT